MKLPKNNAIEKVPDASPDGMARGMDKVHLAFRHGRPFLYATDGQCLVRVEVETSDGEIKRLEGELGAAGLRHTQCAIEIPLDTYKALRKCKWPICLDRVGSTWSIRQGAVSYRVELTPTSRIVDIAEDMLAREFDRLELATIAFNPSLLALCHEAIDTDAMVTEVEIGIDPKRPLLLRKGSSVAAVMPCNNWKLLGIDKLREAAHQLLASNTLEVDSTTPGTELAALILKTLGEKQP